MPESEAGDHIEGHVGDGAEAVAIGKQITQVDAQTVYLQGGEATPTEPTDCQGVTDTHCQAKNATIGSIPC